MATYNLGTAEGRININTDDLKSADIVLRQAGRGLLEFGGALVAGFGYVIKVGADFEKQMSFISAITNESADNMKLLRDEALNLGKEGPFGPREVAAAFVDLAKAGLTTAEIIGGVAEATKNLAAAADLKLAPASEIVVNIMRTFGLTAAEAVKTVDTLAGAANASTIDVTDLGVSLKYAGSVANAQQISFEDLTTSLALLGNAGIKGSTGGTIMRRVLLQLNPTTKQSQQALKDLGIITEDGKNKFFDSAGNAKDLATIFQILQDATKNLTNEEKVRIENVIFGARAVSGALILTEKGAAGFKDMYDQINRTTAADVAAERMDNLAGSLKKLHAAVEAVFIQAGSPFQKMLQGWADAARKVVLAFGELPSWLQTVILGSIGLIGVISILAGGFLLTVGNIVRMVRVLGELSTALPVAIGFVRAMTVAVAEFTVALLTNPIFLIITAITLLIVGLVLLYQHWTGFHKAVDATWQLMQKVWDAILGFFKDIPGKVKEAVGWIKDKLGGAWDTVKEKSSGALKATVSGVKKAGKAVGGFAADVSKSVGQGTGDALGFLIDKIKKLPGALGDFASNAGKKFVAFFDNLPHKVGYALGQVLGTIVKFLKDLTIKIVGGFAELSKIVLAEVAKLPGQIAGMLANILSNTINWGIQMAQWGLQTGMQFVGNLIGWISQLPEQVASLLFQILSNVIGWAGDFAGWAFTAGSQFLNNIIQWVSQLPGKVFGWLNSAWNWVVDFVPKFAAEGLKVGQGIFNGIKEGLGDIVKWVLDKFLDIIRGIKNLAVDAFNAAKDFGKGIWHGFQDAVMGSPHTKIEYAMWEMDKNVRDVLKGLQGLSSFGISGSTSYGATAGVTASAAAQTNVPAAVGQPLVITGPLMVVEHLTTSGPEDAVAVSRELYKQARKEAIAKGDKLVSLGVS